MGVDKIKGD